MTLELASLAIAASAGIAAGILAGLFGVGGGIVFVPVLVLLFSFGQLDAQATSLAAIIPVAVIGAWRQSGEELVNWRAAALMGFGAAVGVLGGAEIATRLPDATLSRIFGVVVVLVAGEMLISATRRLRAQRRPEPDLSGASDDPRRP